jgi:hypothetical protein
MNPQPNADDEQALADYEELVRTAPPEDLQRINEEAFAQLTPDQRDLLFKALVDRAGDPADRPADTSPTELARAASALEARQPGTLGGIVSGRDPGFGIDPGLLTLFVGYAIGSELSFAYLAASPLPGPDGSDLGGGFDGADGIGIDGF